jgi:hypothetical protein
MERDEHWWDVERLLKHQTWAIEARSACTPGGARRYQTEEGMVTRTRTAIDLDDGLIEVAMRLYGTRTKQETVDFRVCAFSSEQGSASTRRSPWRDPVGTVISTACVTTPHPTPRDGPGDVS